MLAFQPATSRQMLLHRQRCGTSAAIILFLIIVGVNAQAQFISGSTGTDGPLNVTQSTTLQVPESGVFNFTTVTIASNADLKIIPNSRNTTVVILATGNVDIGGYIDLRGNPAAFYFGGKGGPGGFRGGNGGTFFEEPAGKAGDGPGGGNGGKAVGSSLGGGGGGGFLGPGGDGAGSPAGFGGTGGMPYGTRTLLPLVAGSGGGGGAAGAFGFGGGAGGGGGAILIASSGTISFPGSYQFRGVDASGGASEAPRTSGFGGGSGSGGAIRLVANTISGSPYLSVGSGGSPGFGGALGSSGYMRVEAFDLSNFFPRNQQASLSLGQPNPVTLPNNPQLKIVSVGGINAPANPKGSFYQQPDIVVPTSTANPVTVNLQANNLPVGTVLQVTLTNEAGIRTSVNSTPLAGSLATSTASASVTLPTTGLGVISATVTLNVLIAYGTPMFIEGERVDKMEVAAAFGGQSQVTYITASGRRVREEELLKQSIR